MLRGFPGLSDYFVMPPVEARALDICELHGKPIDSNSLNITSLVGTGHGLVTVTSFLPISFGSRWRQEIAALHDRPAALPLVSCALQHALYVDIVACIGLDANQVRCQTDKIADTARAAGFSVHPVTKANMIDEFLGSLLADDKISF